MLELAVLGMLTDQPEHGYVLKRRLGETLGPLWGVSFGSLYPALRRLERAGAIEEVEDDAPASETTRRTRKAYRITELGEERFAQLLAGEVADDDRAFALKLSLFRYLGPSTRLALLERRHAQLTQRLSRERKPPIRTIDQYTRALVEHRVSSIEHDLEWIDELIAQERATAP